VARGSWRPDGLIDFGVRFDADTAAEIRRMAIARGTSFSESVRLLVEWGLEAARGGETVA
jgi:hypothetical protein